MAHPSPALATDQPDIVAALRALPLLTTRMSGDVTVAVVFDPTSPASKADADAIKKIIDDGVSTPPGVKLNSLLISVDQLGRLSRTKIAFLTPGLTSHLAEISTAASAASVLTISTDIDYVRSEQCILGVSTKPAVAIFFSKSAADAAKIEFSQDFSMLAKQL